MHDIDGLIARYFEVWNETDDERRQQLIAATWSDDGTYVDPLLEGNGPDGIDAMVAAVHGQFPGHRFERVGDIDSHHDRARFGWKLVAPEDGILVVRGIDVAVVAADGRLQSITGFVDEAPGLNPGAEEEESDAGVTAAHAQQ